MAKNINKIVVAHYDESLEWIDDVKGYNFDIYSKGGIIHQEAYVLPNIGRESHTYFKHIVSDYYKLPSWTFFTQGNPFDHVINFVDIVNNFPKSKTEAKISIGDIGYFFSNGHFNSALICNEDGTPHHSGMSVDRLWSKLFKQEPPETYLFTAGCIFAVSKRAILKRDIDFYRNCLEITETDDMAPWEFERIMHYIFNPNIK